MATNSASANPIGHRTGPVVDSVPPVSEETKAAVRTAAAEAQLQPHLSSTEAREKKVEGLASGSKAMGAGKGLGGGEGDVGDTKG